MSVSTCTDLIFDLSAPHLTLCQWFFPRFTLHSISMLLYFILLCQLNGRAHAPVRLLLVTHTHTHTHTHTQHTHAHTDTQWHTHTYTYICIVNVILLLNHDEEPFNIFEPLVLIKIWFIVVDNASGTPVWILICVFVAVVADCVCVCVCVCVSSPEQCWSLAALLYQSY